MLKKLSAYPRQNGLAVAMRELGRLDRSLYMLRWLLDLDLRRRAQAGLNKGAPPVGELRPLGTRKLLLAT